MSAPPSLPRGDKVVDRQSGGQDKDDAEGAELRGGEPYWVWTGDDGVVADADAKRGEV